MGRSGRALRLAGVLTLIGLGGALLAGSLYVLGRSGEPGQLRASLSVAEALKNLSDAGFVRAVAPRTFSFPRDHGPHPDYKTEWWHYTGNLKAADGRRFGFQLTFFRNALVAKPVERSSEWGASQVYMAHFAVSDVTGRRFYAFERLSRAALGLAGAAAEPFHVWVEDWSAGQTGREALPMRLSAAAEGVSIDLTLRSLKPVVLEGDRGLSRKGPEPGAASYYYSLTRIPTQGVVAIGSDTYQVLGLSWMDREWGTSALGQDQVGWDWFGLRLADGRDVMFYRLRRRDGSADRRSAGTLVAPDGSTHALAREDVAIEVLDTWWSARTGSAYPSHWRLGIPREGLELEITPYLPDQELDLAVRYWEGAVKITGAANGRPIGGDGYVELTGYADTR